MFLVAKYYSRRRTYVLHYRALMYCCRVDFRTQTRSAGAKASLEAQRLTDAIGTVFDLQTGTLTVPQS